MKYLRSKLLFQMDFQNCKSPTLLLFFIDADNATIKKIT
jgi:hypothetical protein